MPTSVYIPHLTADIDGLDAALAAKQATLVSGTSIKTVNGASILGSGDLTVSGATSLGRELNMPGVLLLGSRMGYRAPVAFTLNAVRTLLRTAPSGGTLTLQVMLNGVEVTSGSPTGSLVVASGATSQDKTGLAVAVAAFDLIEIVVGTPNGAKDLYVNVEGS